MTTKRARTDLRLEDFISKEILDRQSDLKTEYAASKPYPHCVIQDVFRPSFLRDVQKEIKDNSRVNFKESDLFKVYQSIDFANLNDTHKETMPNVMILREILYSDRWRTFIEDVAGLPPNTLSTQVDCACNCHDTGGHLLCHDDVIGTRKVSYILYLTDEPAWQAEEGGALELYDSTLDEASKQRIPDSIPCKYALPVFNHLAFFMVDPGYSFHAVQEVWGSRPRLSLQGWYHAATEPENIKDATLQRLKSSDKQETGVSSFTSYQPNGSSSTTEDQLSDEDVSYLKQYLNETYLQQQAMDEMKERFEQDSSIQLRNFLNDTWIKKIDAATAAKDKDRLAVHQDGFYQQGMGDGWQLVGPSHMQRFLQYQATNADDEASSPGELLAHLRTNLLESQAFRHFLRRVCSLGDPLGYRGLVRRFRPGADYTVAHYGLLTEESMLDATLCFVSANSQDDDDAWQSGDCGGFECYIAADDDETAADEYDAEDDTELLSVSASNNTLSLVYRDPGTMRFIKYVSSKAPSSRWDVAMEYQLVQDKDDEEEDDVEEEVPIGF